MTNDIKRQFQQLDSHGEDNDCYKVLSLPDMSHKLGKSKENFPVFFVNVANTGTHTKNILREHLSVEYNQMCRIACEGLEEERNYAILTLRSTEWSLQAVFIDIVSLTLGNLPPIPSCKEISIEVENLITIFSALDNPPVKKMQGLWGELLVIAQSKYPETLINAWHNSPSAKFDFTLGRDKIEVKTTSGENRAHRFSLDQLNPSPSSRMLIASIIVRESGEGNGGKSIRQLFEEIMNRVSTTKERLHLYQVVAETVGRDFSKIDSTFFDYTEACDTLAYFRAQDIPRIKKQDVPQGVTEVKFTSQLTDLPEAFSDGRKADYSQSPLFKSIL